MSSARLLRRGALCLSILVGAAVLIGLANARVAGTGVSKRPAVSHVSGTPVGPPPPPPDTIYDQYDNPGNLSSSSQNYEASNNQYDDELADDFVIPGGADWNIQTGDGWGGYFNAPVPHRGG